ncbi:PspA/IM30 family protein [Streptomyces sp. NBC_01808]|uniref:PspA/IM30 family protein n=1 Tax=Streptomyces sp. NBC_01808 TaxID=2975947 RepID=UPI002DD823B6|nr:PspA/IM30 family protein [Streptomyces sp. NBC_01808]WSA40398.1 PspA/IM30 family protein [Streptomyces sp. NBC_01808]
MTGKQTVLGRTLQLARADVSALVDQAEDPQKMLDQLIRDYSNNIREADLAVATAIGNLRLMEADHKEDTGAADEWGAKALAASRKADEVRAGGDAVQAETFDNLARKALERQITAEDEATAAEPLMAAQTEVVERLKQNLDAMRERLTGLESRRDRLMARTRAAEARTGMLDAVARMDVTDPTADLGRFEAKIRREEARATGRAEPADSSLDGQFEQVDDLSKRAEIDARLARLKDGEAPPAGGGRAAA